MSSEAPFFTIGRRFAAPRDAVWRAWTRPEEIGRWLGPPGAEARVLRFELRPGGVFHFGMKFPGGEHHGRFKYREVSEPARLVWEHAFADAEGNVARAPFNDKWPLVMLSTVTFADADGATEVTLVWEPLDCDAEQRRAFEEGRPGMTQGWTGSFDRLEKHLAEG